MIQGSHKMSNGKKEPACKEGVRVAGYALKKSYEFWRIQIPVNYLTVRQILYHSVNNFTCVTNWTYSQQMILNS